MPIDSDTIRKPKLILYEEGYTISRVKNEEKFMDFSQYPRSYRHGKFLQPGWTPGQQELEVREININSDNLTIGNR